MTADYVKCVCTHRWPYVCLCLYSCFFIQATKSTSLSCGCSYWLLILVQTLPYLDRCLLRPILEMSWKIAADPEEIKHYVRTKTIMRVSVLKASVWTFIKYLQEIFVQFWVQHGNFWLNIFVQHQGEDWEHGVDSGVAETDKLHVTSVWGIESRFTLLIVRHSSEIHHTVVNTFTFSPSHISRAR